MNIFSTIETRRQEDRDVLRNGSKNSKMFQECINTKTPQRDDMSKMKRR